MATTHDDTEHSIPPSAARRATASDVNTFFTNHGLCGNQLISISLTCKLLKLLLSSAGSGCAADVPVPTLSRRIKEIVGFCDNRHLPVIRLPDVIHDICGVRLSSLDIVHAASAPASQNETALVPLPSADANECHALVVSPSETMAAAWRAELQGLSSEDLLEEVLEARHSLVAITTEADDFTATVEI